MFRWLDRATNFLLRFAYDCMKVFLIFVMIARAFNKSFAISGLFGYTAGLFLISIAVSYFLSSLDEVNRAKYKYIGVAGVILSLFVGIQFNPDFEFTGQMIMGGYFVIVWMNGIRFIAEKDNTHFFFKRFFQTFLLMMFISMSIGIGQLRWYISELQPFYTVFFLSVIMNLISMNLKAAYQEASANIMQKSKRVLAFNIISIVILTLSILGLTVLFSNISLGWMEDIIRFALMPIAQFGAWFSRRIRERAIRNQRSNGSGEVQSWSDRVEEMQEGIAEEIPVHTQSQWDQYIEWFVLVLAIALLVGLAYYLTKQIEKRKVHKEELDSSEFRESLLTGEYIRNKVAERLSRIVGRINMALGLGREELPLIRELYRDYMTYIARKGVGLSDAMTPNEILEKDRRKRGMKEKPAILTDIYYKHRYGGVPEEDFDRALLDEIENAMDTEKM